MKAFKDHNITLLPNWPKHSPDLNPQENVWPVAEKNLRKLEKPGDKFSSFPNKAVKAVKQYKAAHKLVGSMASRVKLCIESQGGMIKK